VLSEKKFLNETKNHTPLKLNGRSLRQIQHLSDRTANVATYLVLFTTWPYIPVEGVLHKRILITFGNIIRNINSVEQDIAFRQLALN
jgi:hypothetical protein